jgi:D-alanyl-D-alanine dipeptidase
MRAIGGALALSLVGLVACAAPSTGVTLSSAMPEGFIRLSDVAPDIVQEIRYAGEHNFVGRPVAGYEGPQCWLTREAADALVQVQAAVKVQGYSLKVYDCFRPQRAVSDFVEWAKDPADDVTRAEFYPRLAKDQLFPLGLIAEKSGHSRGSTVDVTLVPLGSGASPTWQVGDAIADCAAPVGVRFPDTSIDMGTGFDCFDPLAATAATQITPQQQDNRRILVAAMEAAGFTNLPEEWWHYTLKDEPFPDAYFDALVR